jgi:hypothetical protein
MDKSPLLLSFEEQFSTLQNNHYVLADVLKTLIKKILGCGVLLYYHVPASKNGLPLRGFHSKIAADDSHNFLSFLLRAIEPHSLIKSTPWINYLLKVSD